MKSNHFKTINKGYSRGRGGWPSRGSYNNRGWVRGGVHAVTPGFGRGGAVWPSRGSYNNRGWVRGGISAVTPGSRGRGRGFFDQNKTGKDFRTKRELQLRARMDCLPLLDSPGDAISDNEGHQHLMNNHYNTHQGNQRRRGFGECHTLTSQTMIKQEKMDEDDSLFYLDPQPNTDGDAAFLTLDPTEQQTQEQIQEREKIEALEKKIAELNWNLKNPSFQQQVSNNNGRTTLLTSPSFGAKSGLLSNVDLSLPGLSNSNSNFVSTTFNSSSNFVSTSFNSNSTVCRGSLTGGRQTISPQMRAETTSLQQQQQHQQLDRTDSDSAAALEMLRVLEEYVRQCSTGDPMKQLSVLNISKSLRQFITAARSERSQLVDEGTGISFDHRFLPFQPTAYPGYPLMCGRCRSLEPEYCDQCDKVLRG